MASHLKGGDRFHYSALAVLSQSVKVKDRPVSICLSSHKTTARVFWAHGVHKVLENLDYVAYLTIKLEHKQRDHCKLGVKKIPTFPFVVHP